MKDGIHPSGYVGIRKPKKQTNAAKIIQADDVTLADWDEDTIGTLDDFANIFWDKAVEKILNVLKTEE